MTFGDMATTQLLRPAYRWREICIKRCRNIALIILGWLAGLFGMRLVDQKAKMLPEGTRPVPTGHLNFDPNMAEFFGGKDKVHKAVVYQCFMAWIETNLLAGRNIRDGQAYAYNTYEQWAAQLRIFHPKTIQKHIKDFEAMGLLKSLQPNKWKGDCTKHYTSPLRLADNVQQMLPGWEDKTPRVGAEDSDHSTIQNPAIHQPAMKKAKTPTPTARAQKSITAGGVAEFPTHIPGSEMPEKKSDIPEARPESDEHDPITGIGEKPRIPGSYPPPPIPRSPSPTGEEPTGEEETAESGNTPVVDVPEWMPGFFTGCTGDELLQILQQFGEEKLLDAKAYALDSRNKIVNPPGYVRVQLARGWDPPRRGERLKPFSQDGGGKSDGSGMAEESTAQLLWIVSDDCNWSSFYKEMAKAELATRQTPVN